MLQPTESTGLSESLGRMRGADLYRAIFESESPETNVQKLSPQAVYLALIGYGIESGTDLLRIVPDRYYRVFLDFQFWERDEFSEEAFWRWLEVIDQDSSLVPLQQFMRAIDERLLARIVGMHVHAIIGEEKAEAPPGAGYYTPDQGYTWVSILIENPRQHRLLARLLAMIFQSSPEYFYQVINMSSGSTAIELTEEAFREKSIRLADEGLPDAETIARIHASLEVEKLQSLFANVEPRIAKKNAAFAPVLYLAGRLEPLSSVLEELSQDSAVRSELESEISLLANAAILRFIGSVSDAESVEEQVRQVRSTLNLGLDIAITELSRSGADLVHALGLQPFYRLGLGELRKLRRQVREHLEAQTQQAARPELQLVAEGILKGDLPMRFHGLSADGRVSIPADEPVRFEFFASQSEIRAVDSLLKSSCH